MSKLAQKLKSIGLKNLSIEKIIATQNRLGLSDDDPMITLFIELETYLRLYEEIPEKISKATNEISKETRSRINLELSQSASDATNNAKTLLIETTKLRKAESNCYSLACLLTTIAFATVFVQPIQTKVPEWINKLNDYTNIPSIELIWAALNTPSYISISLAILLGIVIRALSINWISPARLEKRGIDQ